MLEWEQERKVSVHTHTHTWVHTYMGTHIHRYTHTWVHTYMATRIHARLHTHIYVHLFIIKFCLFHINILFGLNSTYTCRDLHVRATLFLQKIFKLLLFFPETTVFHLQHLYITHHSSRISMLFETPYFPCIPNT